MTVNLTISDTAGGDSLADTIDAGSITPGDTSDFQDLFISHDAVIEPITDVALYIQRYVGSSYLGSDPDEDLVTYLGWGDAGTGGVFMSMTPDSPWVEGTRFAAGWAAFRNGYGDVTTQIPLAKESIVVGTIPASDGEIPVNGISHIQVEQQIPASAGTSGYRAFTLVIAYSATS